MSRADRNPRRSRRGGRQVLPVKKPVREKEGIEDGDRVTVRLDVPSR
jgi:hypothetical protein